MLLKLRLLVMISGLLIAVRASGAGGIPSAASFQTSDRCTACHTSLTSLSGESVSIAADWRTTLMANSSRDPYWQASVRRETQEHPTSAVEVQDECSICHMPIARYEAKLRGQKVTLFDHLPMHAAQDRPATDGVSCSVCHQITPDNLGQEKSYNGGFIIAGPDTGGRHDEFGPFDIDPRLMQIMRTSTEGYQPTRGDQIRSSELCATCHTLKTTALGPDGSPVGALPEQVPYQEWLHSAYRQTRSCQSCHMPAVARAAPISRVLGAPREGLARHEFVAANFVMQQVFSAHRDELGAVASAEEFASAADRTVQYLQSQAARLNLAPPVREGSRLQGEIMVSNLGGHKLPTAFPSRRAWLHITVRDAAHRVVFESGALRSDGSIEGNANDADPSMFEPHYSEIRSPDQVQIYEPILHDSHGNITTGLLSATGYAKDNRLLPDGFDKETADADIAVHGNARDDRDFTAAGHRIRYSVSVGDSAGPFEVAVELLYQPVGYRWAKNLERVGSVETHRFSTYFNALGPSSATTLARTAAMSR